MALIGHWLAADASGSTIPDISGGGLDGTFVGGAAIVTLDNGEAAIRCAETDGIEVADAAKWNLGDFTLMVRFSRDSYFEPAPLILHKPLAGGLVDSWSFMHLSGVLVASIPSLVLRGRAPGGFQEISNPVNPLYNQPVTAWVTRSGSDVTWGINDAIIGTSTFGTAFPEVAEPLRFGSCNGEASFAGDLAFIAIRIYDNALSYNDVQTAYLDDAKAPLPTPAANSLLGRWRALDGEGSGLVFPSRSNGFDGALGTDCAWVVSSGCPAVNCITVTPPSGPPLPVAGGMISRSGAITVEHDPRWRLNPGGDFTVICRIQFTDSAHDNGIAGHNEDIAANNVFPLWEFYLSPAGATTSLRFAWCERDAANVRHTVISPSYAESFPTPMQGYAVVKSGTTYSFYNETLGLIGSTVEAGDLPNDTVAPLWIGRSGDLTFSAGDPIVETFRMYNYALAAPDVAAAMLIDAVCVLEPIAPEIVTNDELVFTPLVSPSPNPCVQFGDDTTLLTADWEFGEQSVPIYLNNLEFITAVGEPSVLRFTNAVGADLAFDAQGLVFSKANVRAVYGHYLGWSIRGENAPYRIETVEMEVAQTRAWDTSP